MKSFYFSTLAEMRKLKGAFIGITLGAVLLFSLSMVILQHLGDKTALEAYYQDPWNRFLTQRQPTLQLLVLPLVSILLSAMLAQIEYRNDTWKQLHVSPQKPLRIALSKLLVLETILLLFIVLYNMVMIFALLVLDRTDPQLRIEDHVLDKSLLIRYLIQSNLSISAMTVIQFWLAYHFRHFFVSVGLGISLWIAGSYLLYEAHWSQSDWFPYSMPMTLFHARFEAQHWPVSIRSLAYAFGFFVLGQLIYERRKKRF